MRRDPYYCIIIWVLLLLADFPRCGKPGFGAIKRGRFPALREIRLWNDKERGRFPALRETRLWKYEESGFRYEFTIRPRPERARKKYICAG